VRDARGRDGLSRGGGASRRRQLDARYVGAQFQGVRLGAGQEGGTYDTKGPVLNNDFVVERAVELLVTPRKGFLKFRHFGFPLGPVAWGDGDFVEGGGSFRRLSSWAVRR
jgi:hypothetical protein